VGTLYVFTSWGIQLTLFPFRPVAAGSLQTPSSACFRAPAMARIGRPDQRIARH